MTRVSSERRHSGQPGEHRNKIRLRPVGQVKPKIVPAGPGVVGIGTIGTLERTRPFRIRKTSGPQRMAAAAASSDRRKKNPAVWEPVFNVSVVFPEK